MNDELQNKLFHKISLKKKVNTKSKQSIIILSSSTISIWHINCEPIKWLNLFNIFVSVIFYLKLFTLIENIKNWYVFVSFRSINNRYENL